MTPQYTRLAGARRTPVSKHTVWTAADHVLIVHSNRISERYQRIYFHDIQALIVEKPDIQQKQFVLGGVLALLIIILISLIFNTHYAAAVLVFLASLIPMVMLILIAECRCYAQTSLGRYQLTALQTNDNLQNALAILTPLILAAQKKEAPVGGTSPSEVL